MQGPSAVQVGPWTQEDGALQTGQRPYPGEWTAPEDDPSVHTAVQAIGTSSASGTGMISWGGLREQW